MAGVGRGRLRLVETLSEQDRLRRALLDDRQTDALHGGGGGGTSGGGMDPWQQSVESRLKSVDDRLGKVDDRLGRLESDVGSLKTDVAVIKATMATSMATKEDLHALERAIGARMQKYLAIGGALVALVELVSTWAAKLVH